MHSFSFRVVAELFFLLFPFVEFGARLANAPVHAILRCFFFFAVIFFGMKMCFSCSLSPLLGLLPLVCTTADCLSFNKFCRCRAFSTKKIKSEPKKKKGKKGIHWRLLFAVALSSSLPLPVLFLFAIGMRRQFFFRISIHTFFSMANCRWCVYVTLFSFSPAGLVFGTIRGCGRRLASINNIIV